MSERKWDWEVGAAAKDGKGAAERFSEKAAEGGMSGKKGWELSADQRREIAENWLKDAEVEAVEAVEATQRRTAMGLQFEVKTVGGRPIEEVTDEELRETVMGKAGNHVREEKCLRFAT